MQPIAEDVILFDRANVVDGTVVSFEGTASSADGAGGS